MQTIEEISHGTHLLSLRRIWTSKIYQGRFYWTATNDAATEKKIFPVSSNEISITPKASGTAWCLGGSKTNVWRLRKHKAKSRIGHTSTIFCPVFTVRDGHAIWGVRTRRTWMSLNGFSCWLPRLPWRRVTPLFTKCVRFRLGCIVPSHDCRRWDVNEIRQ